jgi:dCTP deaminase
MILTGSAIVQAVRAREIEIDPFDLVFLNPNSYNFHLFREIIRIDPAVQRSITGDTFTIDDRGILLEPGKLYLAATEEVIGSSKYAMTLLGRSSMGRLGLFINITADLGHAGSVSRWTLELTVVQPLRVYGGMTLGQVAFWSQCGLPSEYFGCYWGDLKPVACRDHRLEIMNVHRLQE